MSKQRTTSYMILCNLLVLTVLATSPASAEPRAENSPIYGQDTGTAAVNSPVQMRRAQDAHPDNPDQLKRSSNEQLGNWWQRLLGRLVQTN